MNTAIDWAMEIKYLSDEMFPNATKIILVMDKKQHLYTNPFRRQKQGES